MYTVNEILVVFQCEWLFLGGRKLSQFHLLHYEIPTIVMELKYNFVHKKIKGSLLAIKIHGCDFILQGTPKNSFHRSVYVESQNFTVPGTLVTRSK